jgi:hypothetical protein
MCSGTERFFRGLAIQNADGQNNCRGHDSDARNATITVDSEQTFRNIVAMTVKLTY